jgi:hypothetical protein
MELDTRAVPLIDIIQRGIHEGEPPAFAVEFADSAAEDIVEQLRPVHNERFAEAWTRLGGKKSRKRKTPGEPTSYQRQPTRRRPWLDVDNGSIYAFPKPQARSVLMRDFSSLVEIAATLDYGLDRATGASGTAEQLASGQAHLALHYASVDRNPFSATKASDPLKPLRAAAFAGIRTDTQGDE